MAVAALFIDWVFTATWPLVGQAAMAGFDAVTYTFLSVGLAFLTALPFVGRQGLREILSPELRGKLFFMGAMGSGLSSLALLVAVQYTTPASAAIVCQIEVVYSMLLAHFLLRERISASQLAGTALVVAGTGLVLARNLQAGYGTGDLILIGTIWMFQASHVAAKRLPAGVKPWTIAGARLFYGWCVVAPIFLVTVLTGKARVSFEPVSLGLLGYQAVCLGSFNLWLWYIAIRRLDLAKVTAVMLSYPALTFVLSWALGKETPTWHQGAGLALALTGALWVTFQMKETELPAGETAPA